MDNITTTVIAVVSTTAATVAAASPESDTTHISSEEWNYQLIWTAMLASTLLAALGFNQESFEYKVSRMIDKVADEPATVAAFGRTLQNVLEDPKVQKSATNFVESVLCNTLINAKKASEFRRHYGASPSESSMLHRVSSGPCQRHMNAGGEFNDFPCEKGQSCKYGRPELSQDSTNDIVDASAQAVEEMFLLLEKPVMEMAHSMAVSDRTTNLLIACMEKLIANQKLEDEFVRLGQRIVQRPELGDLMADNVQNVSRSLVSRIPGAASFFSFSTTKSPNKSNDELDKAPAITSGSMEGSKQSLRVPSPNQDTTPQE